MLSERKIEFIRFEDGVSVERIEFDIDTASELPTSVDYKSGHRLYQGSIAWDISTGDFYGMQSDGTWVKQGEEEEQPVSLAMTPSPTSLRTAALNTDFSDIKQQPSAERIEGFGDIIETENVIATDVGDIEPHYAEEYNEALTEALESEVNLDAEPVRDTESDKDRSLE